MEVNEAVTGLKRAHEGLVHKHNDYVKLIENKEHWLSRCQETVMQQEVKAKMFIESRSKSSLKEVAENGVLSKGKENNDGIGVLENEGIFSQQYLSKVALE